MALENWRISHSFYDWNQAVRISMAFLRSSHSGLHLTNHGIAWLFVLQLVSLPWFANNTERGSPMNWRRLKLPWNPQRRHKNLQWWLSVPKLCCMVDNTLAMWNEPRARLKLFSCNVPPAAESFRSVVLERQCLGPFCVSHGECNKFFRSKESKLPRKGKYPRDTPCKRQIFFPRSEWSRWRCLLSRSKSPKCGLAEWSLFVCIVLQATEPAIYRYW